MPAPAKSAYRSRLRSTDVHDMELHRSALYRKHADDTNGMSYVRKNRADCYLRFRAPTDLLGLLDEHDRMEKELDAS